MATVNKRIFLPQAVVANGVSFGGTTSVRIEAGWENQIRTSPDGLALPVVDRDVQYVRGSFTTGNWALMDAALTGTLGSLVFYERKSGTAAATGYIKHTLTSPVIYRVSLAVSQGQLAALTAAFECRFASDDATIQDVWVITDSQAAPVQINAEYGGWRVTECSHGQTSIMHVTGLSFDLAMPLLRACNDGDIGYTAVDAVFGGGMTAAGSLTFEDASITDNQLLVNRLLTAAAADLTVQLRQSGGDPDKLLTIANVIFTGGTQSGGGVRYSGFTLPFAVTNDLTAPLTLTGDNKIIAITDA
ncbi:MAG TPA: hypothetical protein PLX18_11025 [Anaerohalosphaeraceae bacterium]|nr:hypothetical protein [Anaerohalosphaeraceae bacterium]HQI08372.1 hypothetical protein [Anaerohalosphaeraceae bacterium]